MKMDAVTPCYASPSTSIWERMVSHVIHSALNTAQTHKYIAMVDRTGINVDGRASVSTKQQIKIKMIALWHAL
jgi:hypothetical protein